MMYLVGEGSRNHRLGVWHQRTLLVLRCTSVTAIALFVAGPAIPGAGLDASSGTDPTDAGLTVLCVDNSASMAASADGRGQPDGATDTAVGVEKLGGVGSATSTRFELARDVAVRVLAAMPTNEQVLILPAVGEASRAGTAAIEWETDKPAVAFQLSELQLANTEEDVAAGKPTLVATDVDAWLARARQLLAERAVAVGGRPPCRIVLVTDWQASGWMRRKALLSGREAVAASGSALDRGLANSRGVRVLWMPVGTPVATDVSLVDGRASLDPSPRQFGGKTQAMITFSVTLQNNATVPLSDWPVTFRAASGAARANTPAAVRLISLRPGARVTFGFKVPLDELTAAPGQDVPDVIAVSLPPDGMSVGNELTVPIVRPDRPTIAIVVPDGPDTPVGKSAGIAARYVAAALMPQTMADVGRTQPAKLSLVDPFGVVTVGARELPGALRGAGRGSAGRIAAVVVLGPCELGDIARDALRRFVAERGGVIIVPADTLAAQASGGQTINVFGEDWQELMPGRYTQLTRVAGLRGIVGGRLLSAVDSEMPCFSFLRAAQAGQSATGLNWEFSAVWQLEPRPGAQPMGTVEGGLPLGLIWPADPRGLTGNVAALAVWPGEECGNWAEKGSFALMMQGLVRMVLPVQQQAEGSGLETVQPESAPPDEFNLSPLEPAIIARLGRSGSGDADSAWSIVPMDLASPTNELSSAVRGFYTGVPLWPWCLFAAFVALAAEMVLAAWLAR